MKKRETESDAEPGDFGSKGMLEGAEFAAGVAVTILIPTLLYCAVTREIMPLYVMACNWVLGSVAGLILYKLSSGSVVSCVPVTRVHRAAAVTHRVEFKKAA